MLSAQFRDKAKDTAYSIYLATVKTFSFFFFFAVKVAVR